MKTYAILSTVALSLLAGCSADPAKEFEKKIAEVEARCGKYIDIVTYDKESKDWEKTGRMFNIISYDVKKTDSEIRKYEGTIIFEEEKRHYLNPARSSEGDIVVFKSAADALKATKYSQTPKNSPLYIPIKWVAKFFWVDNKWELATGNPRLYDQRYPISDRFKEEDDPSTQRLN